MTVIGDNSEMAPISGTYKQATDIASMEVLVEHCAFLEPAVSQWFLDVMCRSGKQEWYRLRDACPEAKVVVKSNDILVSLPPLPEELELTVVGKPGECDMKRMQMCTFGRKPVKGRDWNISVYLCDDTVMAFENVYKKEEKKGNKLLTARAGLFVANSDEDIKISINALETGWQIKGSGTKTIKSRNAWNSPENATDFPRLNFEVCHVDQKKQSFSCGITASHGTDIAQAEIRAFFKQENEMEEINDFRKVLEELQANDDWTGYLVKFRTLPAQLEWKKMQRENKSSTKCVFQLASVNSKLTHEGSLEKTESDIILEGLEFQFMISRTIFTTIWLLTVIQVVFRSSHRASFDVVYVLLVGLIHLELLYILPIFLGCLIRAHVDGLDAMSLESFFTSGRSGMGNLFRSPNFLTALLVASSACGLVGLNKSQIDVLNRASFLIVVWKVMVSPDSYFKGTRMSAKHETGRLFRSLNFLTALASMIISSACGLVGLNNSLIVRLNTTSFLILLVVVWMVLLPPESCLKAASLSTMFETNSMYKKHKTVAVQPVHQNQNCPCAYHTLPSQVHPIAPKWLSGKQISKLE